MQKKVGLLGLLATILLLPSGGMAQQPVRWEATLDNAQRVAGQTNRLVLIHFWAPWCSVCMRMEAEVLSQPSVAAELAANYVAVKINADHFPATARQYGVTALPTAVITTPQGQLLDTMRGRVEAAEYVARLNRVAAEVKQRVGAVYAQVPAGAAPPAVATAASTQPPPTIGQPPMMAGAQPSGIISKPALGASASPSVAGGQAASGNPGLSDSRYADFSRRSQAAPVTPIAQPSSAPQSPANVPPPINYAPPSQPIAPPSQAVAPPTNTRPPTAGVAQGSPQPPTINPLLALDGYCPVSLAEKQQWVVGDRRWGAIHRGRTYLFSGPEEQRRFFTDPDRYAPAISGNDVILATEQGQAIPGMREHGVFFGNRVYLFSSEATLEKFARNPNLYANQAMGAIRTGAYAGQPLQ